jgi:parallel beta-helix repeat protein
MRFFLFISFCLFIVAVHAQEKPLRGGMKITSSFKARKGRYNLASAGYEKPVLIITGNNITIDFNQAVLNGSLSGLPDSFTGIAVLIKGGRNITIRNLKARGFKVALMARGVQNLVLENCDFSYNYRQHLNSTQEKEDLSDWMSYHVNEKDEWLRYGAAIYLEACTKPIVRNCRVTGGQNALMMTRCTVGSVYNNDFSYNSGIGIGLYRSSGNSFLYNKLNFNVRGYSHGVYQRGQDSAGFLVYEQSSNNLFYKNSATHSGDGFFLWAGQSTMETGKGGSNDNRIIGNDFSYAPTNGIEVTFSRNIITNNRLFECDHGIWGGYSFESMINRNSFRYNRIAVAIEHGQANDIHHNIFYQDKEAIRLWARKEQPSDWGYAKYRDTRSKGYRIAVNSFNSNPVVFNIRNTDSVIVLNNTFSNIDRMHTGDSTFLYIDSADQQELVYELSEQPDFKIPDIRNPADPFKSRGLLAGRRNILMTDWGPYDFRYPLIWNSNPVDSTGIVQFELLGPAGKWRIISVKGLDSLSARSGTLPSRFTARKSGKNEMEIIAEYTGPAFTDVFGKNVPLNKPFRFQFRKAFLPIDFTVYWYAFDSLHNPVSDTLYRERLATQRPFKWESADRLDYAWWGGIKMGEEVYRQFLTIAEGKADIPAGDYELSVTWDDAVRVYVDGKRILDEWVPSLYKFDESPHRKIRLTLNGSPHFRVEHVELGGFATLNLKLKKL